MTWKQYLCQAPHHPDHKAESDVVKTAGEKNAPSQSIRIGVHSDGAWGRAVVALDARRITRLFFFACLIKPP
ncbi:protein of unknown function [Methylocaldum szegediense]|uniref:Uncharacterized protein n=1 Tax=Methylocaldum szegediense TaxID=73780 RepID=A0ABM9I928_9GAMM|nr:protein of unknown function [Methylocaldum szegediense]